MSNQITTDIIKKLRDKTGISVMQCKKALESVNGDVEKAVIVLRKQSSEISAKKADRKVGAGIISAYIHTNGGIGSMAELVCETDFVAKNEDFKKLAYDISMQVAAMNPKFLNSDEITEADKKAAREVFKDEAKGKMSELQEKIIEGKLASYFKDKVLMEQNFIKDQNITIKNLIQSATQKFGEKIEIRRFIRFSALE